MSFLTRGLNLTKCEKLQDSIDSQLREILDDDEFVSRILTTVEVLKGQRFEPSPRPRDVRQQLAQLLKAVDKLSGDAQLHIFKNVSPEVRNSDWIDAIASACEVPYEPPGRARDPVRTMFVLSLAAHVRRFALPAKKTKGGKVSELVRLVISEANLFQFGSDGDKITEEICDRVKDHP